MKIVEDIFDPAFTASEIDSQIMARQMTEDTYMENKVEDLKTKLNNLDGYIEANKSKSEKGGITPFATVVYNGNAAAKWAYDNVYSTPDYGADCTNFVSKAINKGGIPTDSVWYLHSNAWIRVIELRNWLINKGYGTQYSSYSNALIGDIVQFYSPSYGNWRHSVMVTAKDNWSSYPYVSAFIAAKKCSCIILLSKW